MTIAARLAELRTVAIQPEALEDRISRLAEELADALSERDGKPFVYGIGKRTVTVFSNQ